ncbi:MAG: hypothetical protein LAQ69_48245, partial [Acidobacteriia bacterium]|nr:hypothetical protein [Terriglobia bacterium]
ARAQELMGSQLKADWPQVLGAIVGQLNPIHEEVFAKYPLSYYWSTYQSEWASDVVFREAAELRRLHPRLLRHGMTALGSTDVMRFLGRRIRHDGEVPKHFNGEVVSDVKEREEGVRIKHAVNGNSEKLYDKAYTEVGSVLRPECTLHNVEDIRTVTSQGRRPGWRAGMAADATGDCRPAPAGRGVAESQRALSGRVGQRGRECDGGRTGFRA